MTRTVEDEVAAANPAVASLDNRRSVPAGVWMLGLVSLFMDTSSEMIHALLPVYMVSVLGTSALAVGMIEGIAEATASITKVFSGALSDWLGKRKLLAALGYGLAAITKPIFPLATSIEWLVAARFIDRVGKGIRGAPRDALVADIAPPHLRGASFGLRQSLDTVGAFLGPLIAIGLMWLTADNFQQVFWIAVIPAFMSVAIIVFLVREPDRPQDTRRLRAPLHPADLKQVGRAFWCVVAVATLFTPARFSEAFLVLKAQAIGLPVMAIPAVMVIMSFAYSLSAYPAGIMSDRVNRITMLALGLALLVLAEVTLAFASGLIAVAIGVTLWGFHMGYTQGLFATLVADTAPAELRGTAYGIFNLVTGVAMFLASVIAGAFWDQLGSQSTFLVGAIFAVLTLLSLPLLKNRLCVEGNEGVPTVER
ncbi:MFS transporter [Chelativorans salis]